MLTLLQKWVRSRGDDVSLIAVHLDQAQPGYDGAPLRAWLAQSGVPYEVLREDTYSVVKTHTEEGATYCALCSRLRRGVLYTAAERLGCNKLALGHHRDDALQTLLMNLFFSGKLQAMPAIYEANSAALCVVRPLIECGESDIRAFAEAQGYPILPCNLCGSQENLQRQGMEEIIASLESRHPHVRQVMLNATRNLRPTHLLDRDVAEAWAARPAHIPEKESAPDVTTRPQRHAKALPVYEG